MTTAEYLQTPETVLPRELAFGVLRVAESPVVMHQRVVRDLTIALTHFTRERRLGEVLPAPMDVILDRIYGAPDLAVEVLSPHPRIGDLHERIGWFARYGVKECWLVDLQRRQVAVLALEAGRIAGRGLFAGHESLESAVLPDLPLSPSDLFGYQ
jgi:Uma2 family endonuclease